MTRNPIIALCLAVAMLAASPGLLPADAATTSPIEVLYIPREDLSRAPGYSPEGLFLPLAEILALARQAQRPDDPEARLHSVYCSSVCLSGALGNALTLDGRMFFRAPSEGWSATLIDDGGLPWVSQSPTTGTLAFLTRLNGYTYLFAKGPSSATLQVRALLPVSFANSEAALSFGRFFAPCRIGIDLGPNVQMTLSTAPVERSERLEGGGERREAAGGSGLTSALLPPTSSARLTIWPTQDRVTHLHLRQKAPLIAPSSLRVGQNRSVEVVGGGLEITDALLLENRFTKSTPLKVALPAGMSLLRAETKGPARLEISAGSLTITPIEETNSLAINVVFTAHLRDGRATLGQWIFPALSHLSSLALRSSDQYAALLTTRPSLLVPAGGNRVEQRYECWGPLPPLEVALVRLAPPPPPTIATTFTIARNEAVIQYEINFTDTNRQEFRFSVQPDWVLTDFAAFRGSSPLQYSLQQQDAGRWRAAWDPANPPNRVRLALHRVGTWGAPGTTATLATPQVGFDGPRPSVYDLGVAWPEELEVRPTILSGLIIVPVQGSANGRPVIGRPKLALRATGDSPRGVFTVRGRDADVQATVVSALTVAEDRAVVRAMIAYNVRLAPTNTLRFVLPAETGRAVKIEGAGIREKTLRASADGDEWTVVTQRGILGDYPLLLEWPLTGRPVVEAIVAPQIRILGVTSQRGFLVLEGSETLRLTAETKNLAEADLAEVPVVPWARESRVLAVYRYLQPPFSLRVTATKFQPEPPLTALVRGSELTTTLSPEGDRLTEASFSVAPTSDNQFFEVGLPKGAQVWSVLVNGEGVKPARRDAGEGALPLLVPVPAATANAADSFVTVLYHERGRPLAVSTSLEFSGPALFVPVNRTVWSLHLPLGFEYQTFGGSMGKTSAVREPAAHFFRTAYYPSRIVFMDSTIGAILLFTFVAMAVVLVLKDPKRLVRVLGTRIGPPGGGGLPEAPAPAVETAPEAALPAERAEPRPGCIGRWLLLMAVGVVIFVLAMISVPNFMEAQVRAKVSRVRTDLRSLAIAVESYYVDNNIPPENLERIYQGPIKYITSPPMDTFAPVKGQPLHFVRLEDPPWYWMAYSVGPDTKDDFGQIIYDPTNGTVSAGDIVRTKEGTPSTFLPKFTALQTKEARGFQQAAQMPLPARRTPPRATPVAGTTPEEVARYAVVPETAAPLPPGSRGGVGGRIPGRIGGDRLGAGAGIPAQEGKPSEGVAARGGLPVQAQPVGAPAVPAAPRQAGLLSLKIETPQSGMQRRFETLGGDSRMKIRLLESKDYRRLSFMVWIAAFLLMIGTWLVHWRVFRVAFVAGIGISLLLPLVVQTAWVAFFNAAFQGVLFSLVAPLISILWKVLNRHLAGGTASVLFLAVVLSVGGSAGAEEGGSFGKPQADPHPARIVVPYDLSQTKTIASLTSDSKQNPLAFISKDDFARLWNAAQRVRPTFARPAPILAEVRFEGTLVPERSTVAGELTVLAANPTSMPATINLQLADLTLQDWSARTPGATLESGPGGLNLRMNANWVGAVSARFVLPCETQGASGQLHVDFPDAAAGLVRVKIPYPDVVARVPGGEGCVSERADGATVLIAPIRPSIFRLTWASSRSGEKNTATGVAPSSKASWQADVATRVTWANLSAANWYAIVELHSTVAGKLLPSEVRLTLDPGVQVFSARGEQLLGASISGTSPTAGKQEIAFRLAESPSAEIVLEGVVPAPSERSDARGEKSGGQESAGNTQLWRVPGIRVPAGIEGRTALRLEIADAIEVVLVEPQRLERRSAPGAPRGYSVQFYETPARDWQARVNLRRLPVAFTAVISELFAPGDGFLRQAAAVALAPRASVLHEGVLEVPRGVRVSTLEGTGVTGWVQSGESVFIAFDPPVVSRAELTMAAASDLATSAATLTISPLVVRGARETRRSASIFVSSDVELAEVDLAKATPRPPTADDMQLMRLTSVEDLGSAGALRAYNLDSSAPLRFNLKPIEATSLDTVFNRVTVSEGLQSLDCVVRAEPRRGRLRKVEALLLLAAADPGAASRLQASGSALRDFRTEPVSDRILRVVAELTAPASRPVDIRFHLDQPVALEENRAGRATIVAPVNKGGTRAFLQLRRAFEGELNLADAVGARAIDPASVRWPDDRFRPLPSDRVFELAAVSLTGPTFTITRHARSEALRAVVEVMRQRTILTEDGFERHELEIVVQNQSEQFLKIALPYPKDRITIYETQVASRPAKATFGLENGREALLVPLIRTGLLDPELTVRVAYTAKGGPPLKGSGRREQRLPEILGGVPVSQSALVLLLPQNFGYSKFEGSLHQVELVDLEVDEALREAKKAERLSEVALASQDVVQRKALVKLKELRPTVSSQISTAKQISEAQLRESKRLALGREELGRQAQLTTQRDIALKEAEQVAQKIDINVGQLAQTITPEPVPPLTAPQAVPPPAPVLVPIAFPRVGDVFVFRQLQGTGQVTFKYASRDSADRRNDILFAVALTLVAAVVTFNSRRLFTDSRRGAVMVLVVCLIAIAFSVALDVTIPAAALALLIIWIKRRKPVAWAGAER